MGKLLILTCGQIVLLVVNVICEDFAGLIVIFHCSIQFWSRLRCCCNFWEAVYEIILMTAHCKRSMWNNANLFLCENLTRTMRCLQKASIPRIKYGPAECRSNSILNVTWTNLVIEGVKKRATAVPWNRQVAQRKWAHHSNRPAHSIALSHR
jgi:hypothetical protein